MMGAMLTFFGGGALTAAPVLTLPASVTVGEDTLTEVSIGVNDDAVAIFTVITTATSSNTNLVSNASLVFSGSGTNRLLVIKPLLHKFGTNTITVVATNSQPAKVTNSFTLNVVATNYPPTFFKTIANRTENENAAATNLSFSISDIETVASNLTVTATSTNTVLVPNNSLVVSGTGTNRTLALMPATNQNGTTLIELVVTDKGGAKATNDFILNVLAVNQPPTFTLGTNRLAYKENFGPVTNLNFVSGVSSGPANQSGESNYFVLKCTTNFFTQVPSLDTNGTLTFQVAPNQFGTNAITFILFNSGSTTNGGRNSLTNTLTLAVAYVNQAPSFTLATNLVAVSEESAGYTNKAFVTALSAGPASESGQTWTFTAVTATNSAANARFTVLPSIATNGTLTFAVAAHSYGTNQVTVTMTDSGGTNNGAINMATTNFLISVQPITHTPVIVGATNRTVVENGSVSGTINVWDYDAVGSQLTLSATSADTNKAVVSVVAGSVGTTNAAFTLTCVGATNVFGTNTIQLIASEVTLVTNLGAATYVTNYGFVPASTNGVGSSPNCVAVADVNGDGTLDLITANSDDNTLTILTNNGNGGFDFNATLNVNAILPYSVVAADLNGDGKLALVTVNDISGTLTILTNNGSGAFGFNVTLAAGSYPNAVTAANLNGNGKLALISANGGADTLTVFTNDGNGVYSLNATLAVGHNPADVIAADVNGDGQLDLISANYSANTLTVLTNNGSGVFGSNATLHVGSSPNCVIAADVNGDGQLDLISADQGDGTLSVLTNNGVGGFVLASTIGVGNGPHWVMAADVNGDGQLDLVSANQGDSTLTVLTNNGNGIFGISATLNEGSQPHFVTVADVKGDGTLALICANSGDSTVTVLTNAITSITTNQLNSIATNRLSTTNSFTLTIQAVTQPPSFTLATNLLLVAEESGALTNKNFVTAINPGVGNAAGTTWTFQAVTATNLAANARFTVLPSIATNGTLTFTPTAHSYGTNLVTVIMTTSGSTTNGGKNSCTNSFQLGVQQIAHAPVIVGATNRTVVENGSVSGTINVWDYDAVGSQLILSATSLDTNKAVVSVTAGTVGTTNAAFTLTCVPAANVFGTNTIRLVASVASYATNTTTTYVTNGSGFVTVSTNALGGYPSSVIAADIYGNGKLALISMDSGANTLTVLTNNGSDVFGSNATITVGANPQCVIAADVNGDGKVDLITANANDFTLTVLTNNGSGVFGSNATLPIVSGNPESVVAVTNLDGHGLMALISANDHGGMYGMLTVFTNNGNGVYGSNATITLDNHGNSVVAADINGDGLPDLIVSANYSDTTLTVLTNDGSGGFAVNATQTLDTIPTTVIAADIYGNGQPALVSANFDASTLTVLTNNGSGIFGSNATLTVGSGAESVIAADMNGDGKVDLITANAYDDTLTVLTNNGSGVFSSNATLDVDSSPSSVIAADLNGDGKLALISVNEGDSTLTVLTNQAFLITANQSNLITTNLLSTTTNLTLTIQAVTQPPSFTLATNLLLVAEESGALTNKNFVTAINPGVGNAAGMTWTFQAVTATNLAANARFTVLPGIATNGTLTFTPLAHSYGTNLVTVIMTTSGSTTNGGKNSCTNSFQLGVQQITHAPVIVGATNRTVLENGSVSGTITLWDYDAVGSRLVLAATSLDTNKATVSVTAGSVGTTNAAFTLTCVPAANVFGTNTIQLVASVASYATNQVPAYTTNEVENYVTNEDTTITTNLVDAITTNQVDAITTNLLSTTTNLLLTIQAVSQPPSFALTTNLLVVAENPDTNGMTRTNTYTNFLAGITAGAGNAAGLTWTFSVLCPTNSATNATFAQFPSVTTNGTLSFQTKNYSFGTNGVTVIMKNSGTAINGGTIAYTNSFQLQVTQNQYPPAFTGLLTNKTILENATTNLSVPFTIFDPLTTNCNVSCTSADTNVVTVSVTGKGTARTLWLAPVTNAFGSNITVTVTADDGTLTNSASFNVTVLWVNQAPSFALATNAVTVTQFGVGVSLPNAVTNILAGPTNEDNQTVSFIVTNSNSGLFLNQPLVTAGGTLVFAPGKQGGTVKVGIKAKDTGDTLNGGVDTSAVQMLTITIPPNPFQQIAGSFTGLFYDTNAAAMASSGYFSLTSTNDGTFHGYFLCAGASNVFNGQFSIVNSNLAAVSVTASDYTLNLNLDSSASWSETVSGSVSNMAAGWNAALQSFLPGYSAAFPNTNDGVCLMALPGFDDPAAGPAGDSVFNVAISSTGVASLTGYLADDTYVSQTAPISLAGYCPIYIPLYGADQGLLIGWLDFTGDASECVSTNSTLIWFNQAGATTNYPNGFTNSAVPVASPYDSTLTSILGLESGTVVLTGGNLTAPIITTVTISDNVITVNPKAANGLNLNVSSATGEILGSFISLDNHTNYIESVILQNTNVARGYFMGTNQGGSFLLRATVPQDTNSDDSSPVLNPPDE
jgi:hypothetical protein